MSDPDRRHGPRFFLPWLARYSQQEDGAWYATYRSRKYGGFGITGCPDELAARTQLREFVLR